MWRVLVSPKLILRFPRRIYRETLVIYGSPAPVVISSIDSMLCSAWLICHRIFCQGDCGRRSNSCPLLITIRSAFIMMTLCVMWQFNEIFEFIWPGTLHKFWWKSFFRWKIQFLLKTLWSDPLVNKSSKICLFPSTLSRFMDFNLEFTSHRLRHSCQSRCADNFLSGADEA